MNKLIKDERFKSRILYSVIFIVGFIIIIYNYKISIKTGLLGVLGLYCVFAWANSIKNLLYYLEYLFKGIFLDSLAKKELLITFGNILIALIYLGLYPDFAMYVLFFGTFAGVIFRLTHLFYR